MQVFFRALLFIFLFNFCLFFVQPCAQSLKSLNFPERPRGGHGHFYMSNRNDQSKEKKNVDGNSINNVMVMKLKLSDN